MQDKTHFRTALRKNQWLYSLQPPGLAVLCLILGLWTNLTIFLWLVPLFIFVLLPIMDFRSPSDLSSPELIEQKLKIHRSFYQNIVRAYIPIQALVNVLGLVYFITEPFTVLGALGLVLTVGVINGLAIAPAHEMNHQPNTINKLLSILAVAPTFYGQFLVEHNLGHHVKVATPEDPASARYGESFWRFSIRSIWQGLLSALKIEQNRKFVKSKLLQSWAVSAVLFLTAFLFGGASAVLFLACQALVGVLLLESVNYIEHYGLMRAKINGEYEPCSPKHSWSSNKLVTNIGLYNLQRHADHHANAARPYEMLRHFEDSPQHPTGYAAMIVLALCPALWFKVMNPRVLAHYNGDITKTNQG